MAFSSDLKEELCRFNNYDINNLQSELYGFLLCGNCIEGKDYFEILSKNYLIIEHLCIICKNLKIEYKEKKKSNCYYIIFNNNFLNDNYNINILNKKYILRGVFLGSGYINEPDKNYHLEILFTDNAKSKIIKNIFEEVGLNFKELDSDKKIQLYIKSSEDISNFLAFLGANHGVLKFEDIRVFKDMKNSINRKVNCESANLNKTIEASIMQVNDIKYIIKMKKFESLSKELQEISNLRLENPELSLKDLGKLAIPEISKSSVNTRLKQIHEIAESLK